MTDLPWLPFLLQTSDALFPTGAYAHSLGFEEIVRLRVVTDEATSATSFTSSSSPPSPASNSPTCVSHSPATPLKTS